MFVGLLPNIVNISRSVPLGTNGRTQMKQLYVGVQCLVMPMNNRTAIENKFSLGKAYDIYFASGMDVRAADEIAYSGNIYIVKLTQPYTVPLVGYTLAMCEQEIS